MRVSILVATMLLCSLFATPVFAQSLARGQVFNLQADHNGVDTDYYDVKIDGALVKTVDVSALVNGVVTVTGIVAPQQAGGHLITMSARNIDGLFAESDPLAFTVTKGQPAKPGKPRITSGLTAIARKLFAIPRSSENATLHVRRM